MQKTILIIGADKGLCSSLVNRFLGSGHRVFADKYLTTSPLDNHETSFTDSLVRIPLDVTRLESVKQAACLVAGETPALDILVKNAGIHLGEIQPLEELDLADSRLQQTMEVNAIGRLQVVQQFLPLLEKGQHRR